MISTPVRVVIRMRPAMLPLAITAAYDANGHDGGLILPEKPGEKPFCF